MVKIRSSEELISKQKECAACLEAKYHPGEGKKAIAVCGDTGCLSIDGKRVFDRLVELVKEKGREDKVSVNVVGCFGFCSQGPFVKIFPEETLYTKVTAEDAEEIIEKDIIGGEVVERLLFVDPQTKAKARTEKEISFYKIQNRNIALKGGGVINQEDINEAIGIGAFLALNKALHMTRQEVIDEVLKSGLRGMHRYQLLH